MSAVQIDVFDTENRPREHTHHGPRAERGRLAGGNGTLRLTRDLGSGSDVCLERGRSDGLGWSRERASCMLYILGSIPMQWHR